MTTAAPSRIERWAQAARPGEAMVYYTGHLSAARWRRSLARDEMAETFAALVLARAGLVHLVQRRAGEAFDYLAIRASSAARAEALADRDQAVWRRWRAGVSRGLLMAEYGLSRGQIAGILTRQRAATDARAKAVAA